MEISGMHNWLTLVAIFLLFIGCQAPPSSTTPNIILIMADDQGWGDLSLNGNANLATPNIDRLAYEGVSFERFFVQPVCSPTRAELLTGRYHVRSGVYSTSAGGERMDLDEQTFAEKLQEAGYQTAAFGKWHNGMQYPYHPNARGFNEFYGFCSGHWGNYFDPVLEQNGQIVKGHGYITDDLTTHALDFIEAHKDQPFMVYLPYCIPHSPMQVPDQWWEKFANKPLELRHRDTTLENVQHTKAALAMCENIDWNVGRVLDHLEALQLEENTIVIYLSDNGPNGSRWNGGMKGRKGSTDEGGVRTTCLLRWPDQISDPKSIPQIAAAIDFYPTLLDFCNIDYDSSRLDGLSLSPLLLQEDMDWPDRVIFNHWNGNTSVRSQNYRLDRHNQLFNMIKDPNQYTDISGTDQNVRFQLYTQKLKWEQEVLQELDRDAFRPFTVGHPDFKYTHLPARDATFEGNITRSNRHPNCTFLTNWNSTDDKIFWDIDVITSGQFEVELYYSCTEENIGSQLELRCGENALKVRIENPHNPPITGMENDRVPRIESYVKDFQPVRMGQMQLPNGPCQFTLQAADIPGESAIDFRLLVLTRV